MYSRINLMCRRMPVEKTFHICWVVRVGLRLRASILIVKDASVLSRMIALGVLWRVSSPYSTQCLIFYEKSVVRKYFLSTDGWLLNDRMYSLYLTILLCFFEANSFFIKFTSARNLISPRLLTGKDSKCVRCICSDEGLTLETSALKLFTVADLPYQLSS